MEEEKASLLHGKCLSFEGRHAKSVTAWKGDENAVPSICIKHQRHSQAPLCSASFLRQRRNLGDFAGPEG
jgi:hypothetical protein